MYKGTNDMRASILYYDKSDLRLAQLMSHVGVYNIICHDYNLRFKDTVILC